MKYNIVIAVLLINFFFLECNNMDEYHALADTTYMSEYVDKKVILTGKISHVPWQHMIKSVQSHPFTEYFDIGDYQIIIYSKEEIKCEDMLKLYGTVIKVEGKGKRPEPSDDIYTEYHLVVDKWHCL